MSKIILADVAYVIMGQSPDGSTYNKHGMGTPLLNGPAEFGEVSPIPVQWTTSPSKMAEVGDVLFCVRGNTLGRQNVADRSYAIGRGLSAIRSKNGKADTAYIGLWLRFQAKELLAAGNGSTFPSVSAAYLESLPFPDIKAADQRSIAVRLLAQLAVAETALQAALVQIQDLKFLRARLLNQVFDSLDGKVECVVLGDRASTTSGTTPPRDSKHYWEPAEIPWVKTGEVAFAPITATEEAISARALAECSLTLLPPKTVLIAMYGQGKTRGQSAILEVPATSNQACFAILPNDTWDSDFLFYWLTAQYQNLRALSDSRGGNQANLNGALLNALPIPAPTRAQQQSIVRHLKTILRELDQVEISCQGILNDLELLPQRLLAQVFES